MVRGYPSRRIRISEINAAIIQLRIIQNKEFLKSERLNYRELFGHVQRLENVRFVDRKPCYLSISVQTFTWTFDVTICAEKRCKMSLKKGGHLYFS